MNTTVVPTGEDLVAMARVIDQCNALGIAFHLVGLNHPWPAIAVSLDEYAERRTLTLGMLPSPSHHLLFGSYALVDGTLIGPYGPELLTTFALFPRLEPVATTTVHAVIPQKDLGSIPTPHFLRCSWDIPVASVPDVVVEELRINGTASLYSARAENVRRWRHAEADGYGRLTIPIDRGIRHYPSQTPYQAQLVLRNAGVEAVAGIQIALFGSHLLRPPRMSGSTDLIEWEPVPLGEMFDGTPNTPENPPPIPEPDDPDPRF